jgi:predicted DNA-binding transcriptional regulator AlpA
VSKYLRYADLVTLGIVRNRSTLDNWIRLRGFPPGRLVGGTTRLWTEREVLEWVNKGSKTAKRETPRGDWRRGRPKATRSGAEA